MQTVREKGELAVQTKSLIRLRQELQSHWVAGKEAELTRLASREFAVGAFSPRKSSFAFTDAVASQSQRETRKGQSRRLPTPRPKPGHAIRLSLFVVVTFIVVTVAAYLGLSFLAASIPKMAGSQQSVATKSNPSKDHSSPRPVTEICTLTSTPKTPVKDGSVVGELRLTIVHDIIIGGERQQQVTASCIGGDSSHGQRFFVLNYWLDGDTWKAKSATPEGSHSRFRTN
jgi:hypothetical protein